MLQVLQTYVSSVSEVCCKCFISVLQKIDQDDAHVAMAMYVCFKCMFRLFHLFQTYIASVLFGCCKSRSRCCIYMHGCKRMFKCFQLLQTYVLTVSSGCCIYFAVATHVFFWCFRCMLQVFQLF
jgi:hypothetical protein